MADHLEGAVDDFQLFGDVLAQQLEFAAAPHASLFRWIEHALLARQVLRQRLTFALAARYGGRGLLFARAFLGNQVLEPGFQLLDLAVQLFGLASELHALEFGQLQLELLDLQAAHAQRLFQRRYRRTQLFHLAVACQQQGLEHLDIVGQGVDGNWHARSLRVAGEVYNTDIGGQLRLGCFQSIPSSSIDSWACVR